MNELDSQKCTCRGGRFWPAAVRLGASPAFPYIAISADGSGLTIRFYRNLLLLEPAFPLSLPEADSIK